MEKEDLLNTVENLRKKMYGLMEERKKLTDPELINMSRKIDSLLNQYIKDEQNI